MNETTGVSSPLPKYRCHKEVWALKIREIIALDAFARDLRLSFEDSRYADMDPGAAYFEKHDPQPGGYYVVYADGYKSYSPAEAFEQGYTLIGPTA